MFFYGEMLEINNGNQLAMIVLYAWEEKRGQPLTLKMFDKMPEPNLKKGHLGFEVWLIKIVLTLSILQVLLYICGQMFDSLI